MNVSGRTFAVTVCAAAAFVAGAALADDAKPTTPTAGSTMSDMKVWRDPQTGKLRAPTPEESAALDAIPRSTTSNVVVLRRPFTTIEVRPNGSAVGKRSLDDMDNVVLTRTPDGKAVMSHSDKPAPASALTK